MGMIKTATYHWSKSDSFSSYILPPPPPGEMSSENKRIHPDGVVTKQGLHNKKNFRIKLDALIARGKISKENLAWIKLSVLWCLGLFALEGIIVGTAEIKHCGLQSSE